MKKIKAISMMRRKKSAQKIAIFLKITKLRRPDFPEGQLKTMVRLLVVFSPKFMNLNKFLIIRPLILRIGFISKYSYKLIFSVPLIFPDL